MIGASPKPKTNPRPLLLFCCHQQNDELSVPRCEDRCRRRRFWGGSERKCAGGQVSANFFKLTPKTKCQQNTESAAYAAVNFFWGAGGAPGAGGSPITYFPAGASAHTADKSNPPPFRWYAGAFMAPTPAGPSEPFQHSSQVKRVVPGGSVWGNDSARMGGGFSLSCS